MIAVSVLSATWRPSLSGRPARILATRSACSCTYGLTLGAWGSQLHDADPAMTEWPSEVPRVPTNRSATRDAVPSCCRHMLRTRATLGYSNSNAKWSKMCTYAESVRHCRTLTAHDLTGI